jgi:hypothetical protein
MSCRRATSDTTAPGANEFRDDPPFVLVTPPPPATNATANLDAPSRRASVNYMVHHICEPMPSTGRIFRTMPLAAGWGKTPHDSP